MSNSPGHAYSPRYLEFLHKIPNNSPRPEDNTDVLKQIKVEKPKRSSSALKKKKELLKKAILLGFKSF